MDVGKTSSIVGRTKVKAPSSIRQSSKEDTIVDINTDLTSGEGKNTKSDSQKESTVLLANDSYESKENFRTPSINGRITNPKSSKKRPYVFWKPEKKKKVDGSNQTTSRLDEGLKDDIRDRFGGLYLVFFQIRAFKKASRAINS